MTVAAMLALLGSACATPASLISLQPTSPQVIWVEGHPAVLEEQDGVKVAVAFDRQEGANLGIRVELENDTDAAVEVDPRLFTYSSRASECVNTFATTTPIIDPETVLTNLAVQESREQAAAKNEQVFLETLAILSVAGDVAASARGGGTGHPGEGAALAASAADSSAAAHENTLSSITAQRQMWSSTALRRNTLFPARGLAGDVYLPVDADARIVCLQVRTTGRVFSFPFKQTITPVAADGDMESTAVPAVPRRTCGDRKDFDRNRNCILPPNAR
jgi:hypothetical protein